MTTSFKQLFEAKKGVDRDTASELLKKIKMALRPEMIRPSVEQNGPWWDISIRDYQYFTPREGEEDDDWPDFTGEKALLRKLKPILKGIEFTYSPEEKDWITISLKAKKVTAKAAAKDKKKKTISVVNSVNNEKVFTDDSYDKRFYADLHPILKKFKKKFITKDEYYALAEPVEYFDSRAAEEAWSKAK
jgi:hypothetical protein